jgi:GT2 family glycosyltransferase
VADNGTRAPRPLCSIVIPVHNRAALTRACLDALLAQELGDCELIVVDDDSSDGTPELLEGYGDAVTVLRRDDQGGFSRACNAGAEVAGGRHLVLLNNDTLPTDGWLAALVDDAEAHPHAAIVGSKLLWPNNTVQHAGVVIDSARNALHVYLGFPAEHPAVNRSRAFQIVTGAAMLVRREAWDRLGGFDESFVNGWEDVDLCLRAGEAGYEVRCCHESVLYHLEGATRGRDPLGDEPNWALFRKRWAERLRPDDLDHYVTDGLVKLSYTDAGVELSVSPELGSVVGNGKPGVLERALRERSRAGLELMRDYVRLAVADGEPVDPWAARAVPRQARPADGSGGISVVVPTSDHGHLDELVPELERQGVGREGFEVIVVEDGHRLGWEPGAGGCTRVVHTERSGSRAAAFNRGILEARGELVLLCSDDFVPHAGCLEGHLAVHAARPQPQVAALGPAYFDDAVRADPFARWIEDSGELFGVSFTTAAEIPRSFFWTANVSLKREFLLAGELFDERFPHHAWDDYELGLRLFARGLQVIYAPAASMRHDHPLTLSERRRVMREAGLSAALFDGKYPRGHRWNSDTDPATPLASLAGAALAARLRGDWPAYYKLTLRREFIRGYREKAWSDQDRLAIH